MWRVLWEVTTYDVTKIVKLHCPICFILMYFYNKINKIFFLILTVFSPYSLSMSLLSLASAASLLSRQTLLSPSFSMGTVWIMAACREAASALSAADSCLNISWLRMQWSINNYYTLLDIWKCRHVDDFGQTLTSTQLVWGRGPPRHCRWCPRICRSSSGSRPRWGGWSPWAPWRRTSSPSRPSSPRRYPAGTQSRPWIQ